MVQTAFTIVLALSMTVLALPAVVHASIGGTASSIESDRVQMQGALRQIVRSGPYTLHEVQSASGIVVREYVSDAGTVFAIAWQGATFPDMRQRRLNHSLKPRGLGPNGLGQRHQVPAQRVGLVALEHGDTARSTVPGQDAQVARG